MTEDEIQERRSARRTAVEAMLSEHSDLFTLNDDEMERDSDESAAAITGWVLLVRCVSFDDTSDQNEFVLTLGNAGLGFTARKGMLHWATERDA